MTIKQSQTRDGSGLISVIEVLIEARLAHSKKEAKRLIEQGAVWWCGNKVLHPCAIWIEAGGQLLLGRHEVQIDYEWDGIEDA